MRGGGDKSAGETEDGDVLNIRSWAAKLPDRDNIKIFEGKQVLSDGSAEPCYLIITLSVLYVVYIEADRPEYGKLVSEIDLSALQKITSRKVVENLVVLHFLVTDDGGVDGGVGKVEQISYIVPNKSDLIALLSERVKSRE